MRLLFTRAFGALTFFIGIALILWILFNLISPAEEYERSFKSLLQLALPLVFLAIGWKWMRDLGKGIHEVIPVDLKCPELEASIEKCRATLPQFIREVEEGENGAYIKFPLTTPSGGIEHIWAYVHFFKDGSFNVSLANEPADDEVKNEGRRDVPLANVEDWQITSPDGSIRGGYSLRALFEYWEGKGKTLSPMMKQQKAQLAPSEGGL